ncbi:hypothetical protein MIDIC_110122 [Alphaproteobacteria bacterium]
MKNVLDSFQQATKELVNLLDTNPGFCSALQQIIKMNVMTDNNFGVSGAHAKNDAYAKEPSSPNSSGTESGGVGVGLSKSKSSGYVNYSVNLSSELVERVNSISQVFHGVNGQLEQLDQLVQNGRSVVLDTNRKFGDIVKDGPKTLAEAAFVDKAKTMLDAGDYQKAAQSDAKVADVSKTIMDSVIKQTERITARVLTQEKAQRHEAEEKTDKKQEKAKDRTDYWRDGFGIMKELEKALIKCVKEAEKGKEKGVEFFDRVPDLSSDRIPNAKSQNTQGRTR